MTETRFETRSLGYEHASGRLARLGLSALTMIDGRPSRLTCRVIARTVSPVLATRLATKAIGSSTMRYYVTPPPTNRTSATRSTRSAEILLLLRVQGPFCGASDRLEATLKLILGNSIDETCAILAGPWLSRAGSTFAARHRAPQWSRRPHPADPLTHTPCRGCWRDDKVSERWPLYAGSG